MRHARPHPRAGFTLIELLVVVAIIALLLAILFPSLRRARQQSKLAVCGSNLRQIGLAIHLYANESGGYLPRGPNPDPAEDLEAADVATNQLWIGTSAPWLPTMHPHVYNGLGTLLTGATTEARVFFCPSDDNSNLNEEWPRIGTAERAYGSYMYRQLDQLPETAAAGRIEQLGENRIEDQRLRVEALALDMNSLAPDPYGHTNHEARDVNILYRDGSVRRFADPDHLLAIPANAFPAYAGITAAIDQILTNADTSYVGQPSQAPQLESGNP